MGDYTFKVGFWYRVNSFSDLRKIKILPSERLTENQNPKLKYFEVLGKDKEDKVTIKLNGTLKECEDYIINNYVPIIPDDNIEEIIDLIDQLVDDANFLSKSENKNDVDISYRIRYAADYLVQYLSSMNKETDNGI